MSKPTKLYRFVTPHRAGKWYPDLETAQRYAYLIGAGFLAEKTGEFCAYLGTQLETQFVGRRRNAGALPA